MGRNVRMDWRGVGEVARSDEMHAAVDAAAEAVAAAADPPMVEGVPGKIELPVKVYGGKTTTGMRYFDRAKATVSLAHAAGLAAQAKHGTLTKAASAAGLRVKG